MINKSRSKRYITWTPGMILLLFLIILTSCTPRYRPGESEAIIRRFSLAMIDATDLPFGWGHRASYAVDEFGGVGRVIMYSGANPRSKPFVSVSQYIIIYPDEQQSSTAYDTAVAEAIPAAYADKWVHPPELDFQGHADEMVIACLPGRVGGFYLRSCKVIARYGDMVMRLYGNVFEDRWLTMVQFRRLVERVDKHMNDARLPQSEPTVESADDPIRW